MPTEEKSVDDLSLADRIGRRPIWTIGFLWIGAAFFLFPLVETLEQRGKIVVVGVGSCSARARVGGACDTGGGPLQCDRFQAPVTDEPSLWICGVVDDSERHCRV